MLWGNDILTSLYLTLNNYGRLIRLGRNMVSIIKWKHRTQQSHDWLYISTAIIWYRCKLMFVTPCRILFLREYLFTHCSTIFPDLLYIIWNISSRYIVIFPSNIFLNQRCPIPLKSNLVYERNVISMNIWGTPIISNTVASPT